MTMRLRSLLHAVLPVCACAVLLVSGSSVLADYSAQRQESGAIAIVEAGRGPDGKPRYSVEAYGASLHDLLTELLRRTGAEFAISPDVVGQVSLVRRNATIDELIETLRTTARPGFVVTHGKTITVSGTGTAGLTVLPGVGGLQRPGAPPLGSPAGPAAQTGPLSRPVTLATDGRRPVAIAEALAAISRQTGAVFRLDNRIPRDLGVAAQITNTPLLVVLESIARTGALKWSSQIDGSILIAPSDWLHIYIGQTAVAGSTARTCARCTRSLVPGWAFCPFCGQSAPRRASGATTKPE